MKSQKEQMYAYKKDLKEKSLGIIMLQPYPKANLFHEMYELLTLATLDLFPSHM